MDRLPFRFLPSSLYKLGSMGLIVALDYKWVCVSREVIEILGGGYGSFNAENCNSAAKVSLNGGRL